MSKNNFVDDKLISFKMGLFINEYSIINEDKIMYFHSQDYLNSFEFEKFSTNLKINFNGIDYSQREIDYLVFLLSRCISLSKEEKIDILFNKLPNLSVFKINGLVEVLEEERTAFILLARSNSFEFDSIFESKVQAMKEWIEIEKNYCLY